jgi:hypothetical protein
MGDTARVFSPQGGVRIGTSWRVNPIETKWVHGKKNVVEADRLLTAAELECRVYAYFACSPSQNS